MNFRKLLLCLITGIALTGFANNYTYAAEEDNVVTEETISNATTAEEAAAEENIQEETVKATVTPEPTKTPEPTPTEAVKETKEEEKATETAKEEKEAVTKENKKEIADSKKKEAAKKTTKKTNAKTKETKKEAKEKVKYSKADLRLLSALIYSEANGESYNGKLAVGIVVMNRKRSNSFPNSVKGVVYEKYQFGPVTNGALKRALTEYDNGKFTSDIEKACIKAAKAALSGTTSITVKGKTKDFGKYLYFSGRLRGSTFSLGNHQFK